MDAPLTNRTYFTDIITGEEMVTMKARRYDELRDKLAIATQMISRRDQLIARLEFDLFECQSKEK